MPEFSLRFDDYTFPEVGETFTYNFTNLVPATTRLMGLDGGFDADGTRPSPAEIGSIQFSFRLTADDPAAMQAKLDAVNRLAALGERKLYWQPEGNYNLRWCWAKVNNLGLTYRSDDAFLVQRIDASFQASDPHWYEDETSQVIPASNTLTLATVPHTGNAITLAKVTVACGVGQTCTNPIIRRFIGGITYDEVHYTGTLTAGQSLVIDARAKSVTKDGVGVYADFDAADPDWLRLLPGSNDIRVSFANSTDAATVTLAWLPTYR